MPAFLKLYVVKVSLYHHTFLFGFIFCLFWNFDKCPDSEMVVINQENLVFNEIFISILTDYVVEKLCISVSASKVPKFAFNLLVVYFSITFSIMTVSNLS